MRPGAGVVRPSDTAYDRRVAGVVSGGKDWMPALVLDKSPERKNRVPVAVVGKVFCKADATLAAIEIGDLLTTAATPGHAMKATDPEKAFSAVLGKALRELDSSAFSGVASRGDKKNSYSAADAPYQPTTRLARERWERSNRVRAPGGRWHAWRGR